MEFSEESELPELTPHGQKCCKRSAVTAQLTCHTCAHCVPVFSKLLGRTLSPQGTGSKKTYREVKVGRPGHGCSADEGMAHSSAKRAPQSVFAAW